jgi:hypothetical protein
VDPTTTLWIVSILAALGFTATGYFFARMRGEGARQEPKPAEVVLAPPAEPPPPLRETQQQPVREQKTPLPTTPEPEIPPAPITLPQFSAEPEVTPAPPAPTEQRPITVPPPSGANDAKTKPPPPLDLDEPAPRKRGDDRLDPDGGAPHLVDHDLSALERELRTEIAARRDAEKRAADLMSRLVSSSQQITALRAKLGSVDDVVRRPTSIAPSVTRTSERPGSGGYGRLQALAPGLFSEIEELRREVERLRLENETLRLSAFTKPK